MDINKEELLQFIKTQIHHNISAIDCDSLLVFRHANKLFLYNYVTKALVEVIPDYEIGFVLKPL